MRMREKIALGLLLLLLLIFFLNHYYQARKEMLSSYNFIITKITVFPSTNVTLWSESNEISFWNFSIYEDNNIKVNDRLLKPKCSDKIYIYRVNSSNKKEELVETIRLNNSLIQYKCE